LFRGLSASTLHTETPRRFCLFQVEKLVARLCLPEHDTLHRSLLCLARNATKNQTQPSLIRSRSSTSAGLPEECIESADEGAFSASNNDTFSTIFSRHTAKNHGWVDVMSVPILGLSIGYTYHPVIPNPKYDVPRDEPLKWHPWEMEPDVITLELEAGPAALRLYGSLLRVLAAIKVMTQYEGPYYYYFHNYAPFYIKQSLER